MNASLWASGMGSCPVRTLTARDASLLTTSHQRNQRLRRDDKSIAAIGLRGVERFVGSLQP
jgi:hypothetical protein